MDHWLKMKNEKDKNLKKKKNPANAPKPREIGASSPARGWTGTDRSPAAAGRGSVLWRALSCLVGSVPRGGLIFRHCLWLPGGLGDPGICALLRAAAAPVGTSLCPPQLPGAKCPLGSVSSLLMCKTGTGRPAARDQSPWEHASNRDVETLCERHGLTPGLGAWCSGSSTACSVRPWADGLP